MVNDAIYSCVFVNCKHTPVADKQAQTHWSSLTHEDSDHDGGEHDHRPYEVQCQPQPPGATLQQK